jgi:hypothetical protein
MEKMRNLHELDRYRMMTKDVIAHYGSFGDHTCGAFLVPSPIDQAEMVIIASSEGGWEHISVSRRNRCPNWAEMEHVKRLFFKDDETAMQLHVPVADHISRCDTCLHLWRPDAAEIPRPPGWMVDLKEEE